MVRKRWQHWIGFSWRKNVEKTCEQTQTFFWDPKNRGRTKTCREKNERQMDKMKERMRDK